MLRLAIIAAIYASLSGCTEDYTVVSPANVRPSAVIEAPSDAAVDSLWFLPGGEKLVCSGSGLKGNLISVIDVPTGKIMYRFDGWPVAVSGELLAVWRQPDTIAVHELTGGAGKCSWSYREPSPRARDVMLLAGGKLIKIGGSVRNLRTGAVVTECEPGATLTDDLTRYVTLTTRHDEDGKPLLEVVLKDTADKNVKWTCPIKTPYLPINTKAEFDAAGRMVLVRAQWRKPMPPRYKGLSRSEGRSWVVDAAEGKPILPDMVDARFTADRKALLAQKEGVEHLCLLSIPNGKELVRFSGLLGVVSSVSGVVAGQTGIEAGSSPVRQRIEFFESSTGRTLGQAKLPGNRPWDCDRLSDDGQFLVLRDGSGLERCVVATSTGDCILHLRGEIGRRNVFTFSFARRIAFAARPGLFAANVQKQILVFNLHSMSQSLTSHNQ